MKSITSMTIHSTTNGTTWRHCASRATQRKPQPSMDSKRMSNNRLNNSSAAVAGQMTLVFIVLKVAEQIDWGWLWVLSPLRIYTGLTMLAGFAGGFIKAFRARRDTTIRL